MSTELAWLVLVLPPPVLGNLLWMRVVRIVRDRGYTVPVLGSKAAVHQQYRELVRAETNPQRRRNYQLLLVGSYLAFAWAVVAVLYVLFAT